MVLLYLVSLASVNLPSLALYLCFVGSNVDSLPVWLRSLMTLCCLSRDFYIQHTAIASLLELINHSQSLALVIQDKHKRYQTSDYNPLSGRLQMVTEPPIYPVVLRAIEAETDFYQVKKIICQKHRQSCT